jgi:hypothetical protein
MLEDSSELKHGVAIVRRISADVDDAVKGIRARPGPANLCERCTGFRNDNDRGIAAVPPREGDDVVAMWSAHLQRLVVSGREDLRQFGAQFQEMPGPGEL